tara:strand:- start:1035 stop:1283 length:249 start_codon:yes stop_codon:yes gene_type:complete
MSKRKETYLMKKMKDRVGIERDPSGGELARDFTRSERAAYGSYMRSYRAKYGLVDGLRTDREGFREYLRKRREEDERRRGYK